MNVLIVLCTCFVIGSGLRHSKSKEDNQDKAITSNWLYPPSNENYSESDDDVNDDGNDKNAAVATNEAVVIATNSDSSAPSNNAKRGSINWIRHHPVSFAGMLDKLHTITGNGDTLETLSDVMAKREATALSNPSLYPGVVAKTIDVNGFQSNNAVNQQPISSPYGAGVATVAAAPTYNRIWDQLGNLHVNGVDDQVLAKKSTNEYLCSTSGNSGGCDAASGGRMITKNGQYNNGTIRNNNNACEGLLNASTPHTTVAQISPLVCMNSSREICHTAVAGCPKFMDPQNTTDVLERVLQELDVIKTAKGGDDLPDGSACDITGVWNSEIVRMGFNITADPGDNQTMSPLRVKLFEHLPPRTDALMDTNWTCHGETVHSRGGPFLIIARKKQSTLLANFDGICQVCGGIPTIFGVWNFVHQPKDCRDLQMFVETKRDIFRKDVMHGAVLVKPHGNDTKPDADDVNKPAT